MLKNVKNIECSQMLNIKRKKGERKKSKSVAHIKGRKKEEEERVCFGISFLKDVTEKGA